MKTTQKIWIALLVVALSLSTCQKKDNQLIIPCATGKSIAEMIASEPRYSYMQAALNRVKSIENLSGIISNTYLSGGFIVFVPTNAAFQALGFSSEADFANADASILRDILKYHIVANGLSSGSSLKYGTGGFYTILGADYSRGFSYGGKPIDYKYDSNTFYLNPSVPTFSKSSVASVKTNNKTLLAYGTNGNIKITSSEIKACNGSIYEVEKVLLPILTVDLTLKAYAAQTDSKEFSSFVNYLDTYKINLSDSTTSAPFTVFAPNDGAYGSFTVSDFTSAQLKAITGYHIRWSEKLLSSNFSNFYANTGNGQFTLVKNYDYSMISGGYLNISFNPSVQLNPSGSTKSVSLIVSPPLPINITCSNGVIHTINTVLIPKF